MTGSLSTSSRVPRLPAAALVRIEFEPVSPDRHTELLYRWGRRPHLSPWWPEFTGTEAEAEAYLAARVAVDCNRSWIVRYEDRPIGYTETYVADSDPTAEHYGALPGDRGWHVLVGPEDMLGTGVPRLLARCVHARLFTDPECERVLCDPDIRNARMMAFCRRLGYQAFGECDLPDRRALLLACPRQRFDELWPDDLGAVADLPRLVDRTTAV